MPHRFKLEHIKIPGADYSPNFSGELEEEMRERGRLEFEKQKLDLIKGALDLQVQGVSYRGFRVGASALSDNPRLKERYHSYQTHNWKPIQHSQKGWDKLCAEASACHMVIQDAGDYIPGLITACNRLDIGDENRSKNVLHPCQNCRNIFRELIKEKKMSAETIIYCVNNAKPGQELLQGPEREIGYKSDELTDEQISLLPAEQWRLGDLLEKYSDDPPYQPSDFAD